MKYILAVFPSINPVNQIRRRLNRDGVYFAMIRAPHSISPGGCGFAIRFEENKLPLVKQAAQELDVFFDGIYRVEPQNGNVKYTLIG